MTAYQEILMVDAGPEQVFRLISGVDTWAALLPAIREMQEVRPGRWRMLCLWRWVPVAVVASVRVDPQHRLAEIRIARRPGIRIAMRWAVDPGPDDTAAVRLETDVVRAPWPFRPIVANVAGDISREILKMIRLLAESDRKAHLNIGK